MSRKNYLIIGALALLLPLLASSSAYAVEEEEIGKQGDKNIIRMFGKYEDEKVQEYVRGVANKVLGQCGRA